MLPTTGYFKDIDCPYYDSVCGRPYCHFRHRKKNEQETANKQTAKASSQVPTYKPTPKSELANSTKSHIPISYVPDLVVRSDRPFRPVRSFSIEKPTYKPTPLSVLATTNTTTSLCDYNPPDSDKDEDNKAEDEANIDKPVDTVPESLPEHKETTSSEKSNDTCDNEKVNVDDKEKVKCDQTEKRSEKKKNEESHRKDKYGRSSSSHSKSKHRDKEKSSSSSSSSSKDKKKEKEDSKKEHRRHSDDKKHKSKHREKDDKKSDKEKKRSRDDDNKKNKDSKHREKHSNKKEVVLEKKKETETVFEDLPDDDYDDDLSIEAECLRIFTEYKPTQPEIFPESSKPISKDETEYEPYIPTSKKRIAYGNAEQSTSTRPTHRPKNIANAANVMANRFKMARQSQANNEQNNIINEMKTTALRRPMETAAKDAPPKKIAKIEPTPESNGQCLIDDILSGKSTASKPRRIAPVQNVMSIQRAKAKLDEIAKQKAVASFKTVSHTIGKGSKRVAHVPEASLNDLPDVIHADRSKLPVNVRSRYLTMFGEECVKLYVSKEDAYQRALNEELKCYERCSTLATYRNSAMLSVNRVKKELQERDKNGLGPIQSDESSNKEEDGPMHGRRFYQSITPFILTEEDLTLHGYPREGDIPGNAVINKEQKSSAYDNIGENERVCCRCHKLYFIDDDGFPVTEEECNYHPLRKRTLRGERKYLCCKSTDDIGCMISNTHVSEASTDRELEGYQSTMQPDSENDPRSIGVYALDCEMCYTTKGLELTRVTIVDTHLRTVYESFVKPLNPIIDYNTRFSGITKDQMDKTSTSILQVQANILHLCNSKTILIGHSLESDMKALKIIHSTIIDTSVMFPHKFGLPHKRALRVLASEYLKKIIQNDVGGHDSAEDALSCMELLIWRVKEDAKLKGIKV